MADEWGGGGLEPEGSGHAPESINLGHGLVLRINQAAFHRMMNSAKVRAQVAARGQAITDAANSMAVTKDAEYVWVPSDNPDNVRARGRVMTGNFEAMVDDAAHSTLWKALASVGSDPKPPHEGTHEASSEGETASGATE